MEHPDITLASFMGGGILTAAFALVLFSLWLRNRFHASLILAAVGSSAWQLTLAWHYHGPGLAPQWILLAEALHQGLWINALLACLRGSTGRQLPRSVWLPLHGSWLIVLLGDRKSTRLNSSHVATSYAVFC